MSDLDAKRRALARFDAVADLRKLHVHQVAQQALRMVRDANGHAAAAFNARPFMGLEEFEVAGDLAHGVAPVESGG